MSLKGLLELHGVDAPMFLAAVGYQPEEVATEPMPKIGIGVTTHNRASVLENTMARIMQFTPGAKIVVVDDASDEPVNVEGVRNYWFDENVGIARAKNKCLELLQDCDHIFLFDDDAYPIVMNWWKPYVDSPEPHLMRIFLDLAGETKLRDIQEIYRDEKLVGYTGPRGVMLYADRSVLSVVGGMDVAFGKWGYEHGDWSNRIHNAGLTTLRFGDVAGSEKLIHSMDEFEEVDRSLARGERTALASRNAAIYHRQWDSAEYREFRTGESKPNVVLTCLVTRQIDPQRGKKMKPHEGMLRHLMDSLLEEDVVVFADELEAVEGATVEQVTGELNPYIQRWVAYWNWLRDHPEIGMVWCVDGTDVELLHDPWNMLDRHLYLGSEPDTVDSGWLGRNLSREMSDHIAQYGNAKILNAGLVGGTREVVMSFIHKMIKMYFDNRIAMTLGREDDLTEHVNDMGILNIVARKGDGSDWNIITGPMVHTTFKANERNEFSWWKHK